MGEGLFALCPCLCQSDLYFHCQQLSQQQNGGELFPSNTSHRAKALGAREKVLEHQWLSGTYVHTSSWLSREAHSRSALSPPPPTCYHEWVVRVDTGRVNGATHATRSGSLASEDKRHKPLPVCSSDSLRAKGQPQTRFVTPRTPRSPDGTVCFPLLNAELGHLGGCSWAGL